jgi:hypothetical protein
VNNWVNDVLDSATRAVREWPSWMRRPEVRGTGPMCYHEDKMSAADKIRQFILMNPGTSSSYQIAKALALDPAYVSSFLNKEFKAGRVKRTKGKGPRGGYVWG